MLPVASERKVFHENFLDHFKKNKVRIAMAVTKLFPFPEVLRDHSFITEKLYNETCDGSLPEALFGRVHLKEYPDLTQIYRSFENGK
ncbi:sp110 nuclear body protein-like [Orycteropus afer afer]|uniref:Sp110 nuclear body protein-like n=1 Tax=Orycteropus afer afer TaxID=1230840 RepID=A0A8B7A7G7_ORYAF|nr:sp110 nuclear body protein-like [Orycteropus afer afer]